MSPKDLRVVHTESVAGIDRNAVTMLPLMEADNRIEATQIIGMSYDQAVALAKSLNGLLSDAGKTVELFSSDPYIAFDQQWKDDMDKYIHVDGSNTGINALLNPTEENFGGTLARKILTGIAPHLGITIYRRTVKAPPEPA